MAEADEGVSLTSDEDSGRATSTISWAEAWARLGLDTDAELSTVQTNLASEEFPVAQSVDAAVDDGVLAKTYFEAPTPGDQPPEPHHGGYRLVGEPQDGGRDE